MSDLRCFNCLLDEDGVSGRGAVTIIDGTAYCADHARLMAKLNNIPYIDPDGENND